MILEAVVFDMDGVMAETEGDGHRVAFNQAFQQAGIDAEWDWTAYGELLKISGGKERMKAYFKDQPLPCPDDQRDAFIAELHKKKTALFTALIQNGKIPLRRGVRRFIESIIAANLKLALATTSNEQSAHGLLTSLLGKEMHDRFDLILAGDIVKKKKPDAEIYRLAAERLQIDPALSFVIEDTANGLQAALAAGFHVCITKSAYSQHEEFTEAAFIVDDLETGEITIEKLDIYIQENLP